MFQCYVNVYQLGYSKLGNILESTNYECILGDGPGRTKIAACKFVSILPLVGEPKNGQPKKCSPKSQYFILLPSGYLT